MVYVVSNSVQFPTTGAARVLNLLANLIRGPPCPLYRYGRQRPALSGLLLHPSHRTCRAKISPLKDECSKLIL